MTQVDADKLQSIANAKAFEMHYINEKQQMKKELKIRKMKLVDKK